LVVKTGGRPLECAQTRVEYRSGMGSEFDERAAELIEAGRFLFSRGWVPATSGNFSARLADGRLALTVSGRHKGRLTPADILVADVDGRSLDQGLPSAETALHVQLYRRFPAVHAVLHPHSVNATLLSLLHQDELVLQGYELLKAFPGIDSHECRVRVPIFPNDQDIPRLAARVDAWMDDEGTALHGYLIAGHGFYTWGASVDDALRHVEAFEFLFDCEMRLRGGMR
jgi:methylthioribulose-1-phosphate dehydratase